MTNDEFCKKYIGHSYHDLYITTEKIPRTSIFNLPIGYELCCHRCTGWVLHFLEFEKPPVKIAGEYDDNWMILDIKGYVFLDSRTNVIKLRDKIKQATLSINELKKKALQHGKTDQA